LLIGFEEHSSTVLIVDVTLDKNFPTCLDFYLLFLQVSIVSIYFYLNFLSLSC